MGRRRARVRRAGALAVLAAVVLAGCAPRGEAHPDWRLVGAWEVKDKTGWTTEAFRLDGGETWLGSECGERPTTYAVQVVPATSTGAPVWSFATERNRDGGYFTPPAGRYRLRADIVAGASCRLRLAQVP